MTQLWAWEYEGKTHFGYEISSSFEGIRRFMLVDNLGRSETHDEQFITNLRKVKVVDEDCQDESHTFVNDTCKYCGQNIPVTEPKNFGAIVEAETVSWAVGRKSRSWVVGRKNRRKFVKLVGVDDATWFDETQQSYFVWSDLINPTIISEGVEG